MIVVTVFLSILNQMELHLVQNRKKNCHHDRIPFDIKGNAILVFSVQRVRFMENILTSNYTVISSRAGSAQLAVKRVFATVLPFVTLPLRHSRSGATLCNFYYDQASKLCPRAPSRHETSLHNDPLKPPYVIEFWGSRFEVLH